jgi:hypothetical protein
VHRALIDALAIPADENTLADWSFGNGLAPYLEPLPAS